jgi:hypothetical protein
MLHLRPGVKEVFLDHLSATHPDLVPGYQRLYPPGRANAPRADQHRITEIVRRSRTRSRSPGERRSPMPAAKPAPTQLPLL